MVASDWGDGVEVLTLHPGLITDPHILPALFIVALLGPWYCLPQSPW